MKHIIHKIFLFLAVMPCTLLTACREHNDEPQLPAPEQMILVYAVNHSSLSGDLRNNERDMLEAMKLYNTDKCKLLVYKYTSSNPGLYEVASNGADREFRLVKEYDKSMLSVTAERVNQVIEDAASLYPDMNKDLFFWGHGSGWVNPSKYSPTKTVPDALPKSPVSPQSFGGEYTSDNTTVFIDIDELAAAVPDNVFDIIWFDCCYMSTIEVAYQFRNKCNTYVAYPTEIMADGLPYAKVLPKVIERNPQGGAEELYKHYTEKIKPEPVTVAVMDMNKIWDVADVAKDIYALGEERPNVIGMQNYSRYSNAQYYDFGQYMRAYINSNVSVEDAAIAEQKLKELQTALDNFVIFKKASEKDFNYPIGNTISPENYSGLSAHNYKGGNTEREVFYRKLDWFKATRAN